MDKSEALKLLEEIESFLPPEMGLIPNVTYFDKNFKKTIDMRLAHFVRFNNSEHEEYLKKELSYKINDKLCFFNLKKVRVYFSQKNNLLLL